MTDFGAGDVVCRGCGMVLGERIVDDSPEWRAFATAARPRAGDAANRPLEQAPLSAHGKRAQDPRGEIGETSSRLSLPKRIVDVALDIYAQAAGKNARRAESASNAAAALLIACRQTGHSRSLKELEAASGIARQRIGRSYLRVTKALALDVARAPTQEYVVGCAGGQTWAMLCLFPTLCAFVAALLQSARLIRRDATHGRHSGRQRRQAGAVRGSGAGRGSGLGRLPRRRVHPREALDPSGP